MKICTKCKQEKKITEFYKNKNSKDHHSYWCKLCIRKYDNIRHKKYRWKQILHYINARCYNKKRKEYKWYGAKGIKNYLTEEDIKFIMKRDHYWELKNPSIDRKNTNGHYKLSNCEFIEHIDNIKKSNSEKNIKAVLQYNLNGIFIREFISIKQASDKLKINKGNICSCAKGKLKTAGKYIWKYKDMNNV